MESWFAIRLSPGASRPHRFYPGCQVEVALRQAKIDHYFPVELHSKRHHRTGEYLDKRFPLIPGYAFVREQNDWKALTKVDYVSCAVHVGGNPMKIPEREMDLIRAAEESIREIYEYQKALRIHKEQQIAHRMTSREAKRMFPEGAKFRVMDSHAMFGGKEARVLAATGRNTIRAVIEMLGGAVTAELGIDYLEDAA